jgi:chromosome segregation ATPase
MQANTAGAISPYDNSTAAEIDEVVESFVSAADVPDTVAKEFSELMKGITHRLQNAENEAAIAKENAREAEARAEEAESKVEELETRLSDQENHSAKERADTRSRVADLEEASEDQESGGSDPTLDESDSRSTTALETVVSLDQQTAESELTSNQNRSRFVAKDILQYSKKCQAGRTISSSDIATILKSGTDCKGRTTTVARVMDFLDKFGEDKVEVVKRRGTKRVIFDEELAQALDGAGNTGCYQQTSVGVI